MADVSQLNLKASKIIEEAQIYLERRRGDLQGTASPEELARLHAWSVTLQAFALVLASEVRAIDPGSEPAYGALSQEFDEIGERIRNLHEYDRYAEVDRAMGVLHDKLQQLVGPHGPGGGRPR